MEQQVEKKKKKLDLLGFQKGLNKQFLEIFQSKQAGLNFDTETDETADLGLEAIASGFQFFIPLKDLKTISMDNSYEGIAFTKPWIMGFNQLHGEVFTITDLEKIIEMITNEKSNEKNRLNKDSRIIYLKNNEHKVALSINQLKLGYTAEFTSIFKFEEKNDEISWKINEGIEFEAFVKQQKMNEAEWNLINKINALMVLGETIDHIAEKMMAIQEIQLIYFIKDVYLDSNGEKPVFVLNTDKLTKFLANVSPY